MTAEVELGSLNLPPCSRMDWVPSSIPGVKVPVVSTGEQRLIGYAIVESDNMRKEALGAVKDCALASVGAAGGIAAITANPGTSETAFAAAFLACFSLKYTDIAIKSVHLSARAVCMW